jgi:hypothetical protein
VSKHVIVWIIESKIDLADLVDRLSVDFVINSGHCDLTESLRIRQIFNNFVWRGSWHCQFIPQGIHDPLVDCVSFSIGFLKGGEADGDPSINGHVMNIRRLAEVIKISRQHEAVHCLHEELGSVEMSILTKLFDLLNQVWLEGEGNRSCSLIVWYCFSAHDIPR